MSARCTAKTINGVKFSVTEIDGVATGNLMDGYVLQQAVFTEIAAQPNWNIRIAFSSNARNYDSGTVKNFDLEEVHRSLKKVRHTLKFLN